MYTVFCSVIAYLIGSANTAIIISKSFYGKDIRTLKSRNPGATNMMRAFGKRAGLLVFVFDFIKGVLSVLIADLFFLFLDAPFETALFAGFFAVFGHIFPVYFGFRGGKGVATLAGAAFALMPLVTICLLAAFAVILAVSRIVSLASGICA
ncbi:MAG: glycerol-3-phosphate 1-O-acyltransferase PlsY, partial [Clostridia bacterium]|nr:glycerol-3-phosphate 1-O-acyltransferase PlsY [Clostridia bacterium]